jgi:hypothetical protein
MIWVALKAPLMSGVGLGTQAVKLSPERATPLMLECPMVASWSQGDFVSRWKPAETLDSVCDHSGTKKAAWGGPFVLKILI